MKPTKYVALFERILPLFVALASVLVPLWTTLNVYNRGPAPEKHVDLTRVGPIDPMHDLSSLYDSATLDLKFKDQTIDNIVVAAGIFRNTGTVPIVPADFVEKLSASVSPPWKIVTVKNKRLG